MTAQAPILDHLAALPKAREVRPGAWIGSCPAHEDATPSLSWTTNGAGAVLVRCHAGCDAGAIVAGLGLTLADLFPPPEPVVARGRDAGRVTAEYAVRDAAGAVVAFHVRREWADGSKAFAWQREDRSSGLGGIPVADLPLYGADLVGDWPTEAPVVLVEGEKAADALRASGVHALGTVTGAAAAPTAGALAVLAGRSVVLWPDADEPGQRHMARIAERLGPIASGVRWLDPPADVPRGWDAADALAAADGPAAILAGLRGRIGPVPAAGRRASAGAGAVLRSYSAIPPTITRWLWRGFLPAGRFVVLAGDGGIGKTVALLDLAARMSRGTVMPDGSTPDDPGPATVLVVCVEDEPGTIAARLRAAGADLDRIHELRIAHGDGTADAPTVPADLDGIEEAIERTGARLVILDPLVAFVADGVDTHKDHDVKRALGPLAELASRTSCTIAGVYHLNKNVGTRAIYRVTGSAATVGAARAVVMVARDPADPSRVVLGLAKANDGPAVPPIAFRIVPSDPSADPFACPPVVEWLGPAGTTVEAALSHHDRPEPDEDADDGRTALADACEVLRTILADGPVTAKDAKREAEVEAGIAPRTLKRARKVLRVVARKVGKPGGEGQRWEWSLPEEGHEDPKRAVSDTWASSGNVGPLRDPTGDLAIVKAFAALAAYDPSAGGRFPIYDLADTAAMTVDDATRVLRAGEGRRFHLIAGVDPGAVDVWTLIHA